MLFAWPLGHFLESPPIDCTGKHSFKCDKTTKEHADWSKKPASKQAFALGCKPPARSAAVFSCGIYSVIYEDGYLWGFSNWYGTFFITCMQETRSFLTAGIFYDLQGFSNCGYFL